MNEIIKNILSSGKLFEKVKDILDEIITTKEEKGLLEIRLQELIREHEQTLLTLESEDRKSARVRETDVIRSGSINLTQNILAYAAIAAFFAITGYIISYGLGKMNSEESFIIGNLTGMAAAIAKDIYGYYFGSSKGEREIPKLTIKK